MMDSVSLKDEKLWGVCSTVVDGDGHEHNMSLLDWIQNDKSCCQGQEIN